MLFIQAAAADIDEAGIGQVLPRRFAGQHLYIADQMYIACRRVFGPGRRLLETRDAPLQLAQAIVKKRHMLEAIRSRLVFTTAVFDARHPVVDSLAERCQPFIPAFVIEQARLAQQKRLDPADLVERERCVM
ncbi:hypothetical protein D3C84_864450 [compost metagenome]